MKTKVSRGRGGGTLRIFQNFWGSPPPDVSEIEKTVTVTEPIPVFNKEQKRFYLPQSDSWSQIQTVSDSQV